jgi:hypothetical protein
MSEQSQSEHVCACGGTCNCGGHSDQVEQVFLTQEEYVVRLEEYLERLKEEIRSVEEELTALRQQA